MVYKEDGGRKIAKLGEGHIVGSFKCDNRMRVFYSPQGVTDHLLVN